MDSPEIQALVARLRLSRGDILSLAREVAEDSLLPSPEHLTDWQCMTLLSVLRLMAEPVDVDSYLIDHPRAA